MYPESNKHIVILVLLVVLGSAERCEAKPNEL